MSKIFYDHLVAREELTAELDKHGFSVEEKEELIRLVDETLHHHTLDEILTHLPHEKHEEFLIKLHNAPHDIKLLEYLKTETKIDIEEKIKSRAKIAKKTLLGEIKRGKRSNS